MVSPFLNSCKDLYGSVVRDFVWTAERVLPWTLDASGIEKWPHPRPLRTPPVLVKCRVPTCCYSSRAAEEKVAQVQNCCFDGTSFEKTACFKDVFYRRATNPPTCWQCYLHTFPHVATNAILDRASPPSSFGRLRYNMIWYNITCYIMYYTNKVYYDSLYHTILYNYICPPRPPFGRPSASQWMPRGRRPSRPRSLVREKTI